MALFDSNGNLLSATERTVNLHVKDATSSCSTKTYPRKT
jgi:hypothetical protein